MIVQRLGQLLLMVEKKGMKLGKGTGGVMLYLLSWMVATQVLTLLQFFKINSNVL